MSGMFEQQRRYPGMRMIAVIVVVCLWVVLAAVRVDAARAGSFGIEKFSLQTIERTEEVPLGKALSGERYEFTNKPYAYTQAGGHPWALTASGELASEEVKTHEGVMAIVPVEDPKDIVTSLPPGLLGDPMAVPRCPLTQITSSSEQCPADTQVGVYAIRWEGGKEQLGPIVNVTPEAGQSAEFAFENKTKFITPLLTAHLVRIAKREEYAFTVTSNEIPVADISAFEVTFWGVPADASHDPMRGRFCGTSNPLSASEHLVCEGGGEPANHEAVPFLSMPTDCTAGAQPTTLRADSWEHPGSVHEGQYEGYVEKEAQPGLSAVTGCNLLRFEAGINVEPDTLLADEPVGMAVTLTVPQNEKPAAQATPHLRDAVVTLPEGVSINPGIVDGIQACDETGPEGINFSGALSEERSANGELQLAPGRCPDASTVGSAEAVTPLLPEPVKGHIYLARPLCGGAGESACTNEDALDGRLYQLYLELGGKGKLANAGVNIKAHGYVEANPVTGQITTKFLENPQAPFSELHVDLNGGPRASLANPAVCGDAITTADLTPWSEPGWTPETAEAKSVFMPGTPDATPSSFYGVNGCANPMVLNPGFLAGTVTPQAGKFSAFTLNLSRKDGEQYLKAIKVHTPPGLLGMLSAVPLCGEPAADAGMCPEASKIGTTRVATGAGSHPFEIEGDVYLTGPHDGDPFGLSVVVHVVTGPFNLGVKVVRARIAVDPTDSTLTVSTDETGPYSVPQIVFGVPVRLQRVTVNIDRPGFMFNPTNCTAHQISASISGAQGAIAGVQTPFAVGGCRSLAFKPSFKVSTSGQTSRASGASLDAKVSYPKGAMGLDANIARVKVSLPRQLPSYLPTLQNACLAATFNANPAQCPAGSVVGIARASTPLLPVGLSGPVYFVSHGGEAFPSLIIVLQGDGVRVDLTGSTFIDKAGITSSTFKTVPDVPVNTFELYLPQGKNHALAANANLCSATHTVTVKRKRTRTVHGRKLTRTVKVNKRVAGLVMPTEFVAQNGAILKQATKIMVTGCKAGRAKSARRTRKSQGRNGK